MHAALYASPSTSNSAFLNSTFLNSAFLNSTFLLLSASFSLQPSCSAIRLLWRPVCRIVTGNFMSCVLPGRPGRWWALDRKNQAVTVTTPVVGWLVGWLVEVLLYLHACVA